MRDGVASIAAIIRRSSAGRDAVSDSYEGTGERSKGSGNERQKLRPREEVVNAENKKDFV
jgi:hypothetical protein